MEQKVVPNGIVSCEVLTTQNKPTIFTVRINLSNTQHLKTIPFVQKKKNSFGIREYGPFRIRILNVQTKQTVITNEFRAVSKTIPGTGVPRPGRTSNQNSFYNKRKRSSSDEDDYDTNPSSPSLPSYAAHNMTEKNPEPLTLGANIHQIVSHPSDSVKVKHTSIPTQIVVPSETQTFSTAPSNIIWVAKETSNPCIQSYSSNEESDEDQTSHYHQELNNFMQMHIKSEEESSPKVQKGKRKSQQKQAPRGNAVEEKLATFKHTASEDVDRSLIYQYKQSVEEILNPDKQSSVNTVDEIIKYQMSKRMQQQDQEIRQLRAEILLLQTKLSDMEGHFQKCPLARQPLLKTTLPTTPTTLYQSQNTPQPLQ